MARAVGLPLGRFEQEGGPLEVRVPWHPDTLWFVPDERHAEMLICEGVGRGRIWTAGELLDVMALDDRTLEVVRTLALTKVALDADLVEINRPERSQRFLEPGPRGPAPGRS